MSDILTLDSEVVTPKRADLSMCLHSKADAKGFYVDREVVESAYCPAPQGDWYPIAHKELITVAETIVRDHGLKIGNQRHALNEKQTRYFGLMEVVSEEKRDYCWVIGLRNSTDKSIAAGICAGSKVFICDNLAFSSEITMMRKHTANISRDLPQLMHRAVGQLSQKWYNMDQRINAYKGADLVDKDAHDLMIRAVDENVVPGGYLPKVLRQWRSPQHEEFKPHTVWSLFNAFTETMKGIDLNVVAKRTMALHSLMDGYVGLVAEHSSR